MWQIIQVKHFDFVSFFLDLLKSLAVFHKGIIQIIGLSLDGIWVEQGWQNGEKEKKERRIRYHWDEILSMPRSAELSLWNVTLPKSHTERHRHANTDTVTHQLKHTSHASFALKTTCWELLNYHWAHTRLYMHISLCIKTHIVSHSLSSVSIITITLTSDHSEMFTFSINATRWALSSLCGY